MTCCAMTVAHLLEGGIDAPADRYSQPAAGMKSAPAGRVDRAGHIAFQDDPFPLHGGIGNWYSAEEGFRVWMKGFEINLISGPCFDNSAKVHDGHSVRNVVHHRQIVRNEQIGQAVPLLKVFHKIEDLGPDRYV